jgi:DNA repair exonuclease SbcCD ATPase subunit
MLSVALKVSSKDIKKWLENETKTIFVPVHSKAKKLTDEMRKALENITEVSKTLLDNSTKEIEKRNMKTYGRARVLNKLAKLFNERMKQIRVPNEVSYDSFAKLVQETQKAFAVTEADVRNYFPRISPFFIFDRRRFLTVFERSKETLRELDDFLKNEYVKTKTLEKTFQLINESNLLEEQVTSLKEKISQTRAEKAHIEREIAETQQKMTNLRNSGPMSELGRIDAEFEALNSEVKQNLQHLQKPFVKLQSLAMHEGGSGLTPDELTKLNQYLENPFEAFAAEDRGCPLLKQILQKLNRAMIEGKLKLKPEKERKAAQVVDNILNKNALETLHQKSSDAFKRKRQFSTSAEITETMRNLQKLQNHCSELQRKKENAESEQNVLERTCNETLEKIRTHKTAAEKNILDFTNKKIHIE